MKIPNSRFVFVLNVQRIFFPKETEIGENRTAVTPATVGKLVKLGLSVTVERSVGEKISIKDKDYVATGATIVETFGAGAEKADVVVRVKCSNCDDIPKIPPGAIHISLLSKGDKIREVELFKSRNIRAFSLEMVPRTTVAQKFDVLSSQSNLAGYAAVLQALANVDKVAPMMITPAGTINPLTFFIIGAGVAGLQAIATARRLGARVEAFDARPETEEQVKSLGAKFLKMDLGEIETSEQGYVKELTDFQLKKQQELTVSACESADVVITTAKLFGKRAPMLITKEMLEQVTSNTLFIDMAVASGGNIQGSESNKLVQFGEYVRVLGLPEAEQFVATSASQMFAENIFNLIQHFYNGQAAKVTFSPEDDIVSRCMIT